MAGSLLLRHAGTRLFTAGAVSPAAAARPALLAGCDGVTPAVMVRLMSTSSSSPAAAATQKAKEEAAKAAKDGGEKKAVVINSYWGIEQTNKLVREDGTEWKWTCFRVRG
jgi:ubiquinol oxidase